MAIERESRYTVTFEGDASTLSSVLSAFKNQVKRDSKEIEQATQIELFKNAQASATRASAAFFDTKKRVEDLRKAIEAIESAGGTVGKELTKQMRDAERAFASATKELTKQRDALKGSRDTLTRLGVDVKNLAAEEQRLATAIEAANRAAAVQGNKDLLGLRTLKDVAPQIAAIRTAFDQLKATGNLSFGELSTATARANQRISELHKQAGGAATAFRELRGQLLVITGALVGVGAAVFGSARAYRDFAQQIAAVNSISNVSEQQLGEMADAVRRLARQMGVDAVESAKALYEIISSGVERPADALRVLEASTRAAVAGLTTVDTTARVGVAVLNAYGLQVSEIDRVFDVLFKTVQDGVIRMEDLANQLGEVNPIARAAKVSLEEVAAQFVVLTRNGINAAESATSIRSAILNISAPAPEAQEKFRDLNIELGAFTDVIRQLADKNLSLPQLRQIIPDARAAKAVQILTQQFALFRDEIGELNNAAGAAQAAYAKLADTPQARVERFRKSIDDLALSFGQFIASGDGIVRTVTGLINGFNALDAGTRRTAIEVATFVAALSGATIILRTLATPLNLFVGAIVQSVPALAKLSAGLDASALAMRGLAAATALFLGYELGKWLRENVPFVSSFGDLLGSALGAGAQAAGLALDGLRSVLGLSGESLRDVRERGQRFTDFLRREFAEIISGARERLRELTNEQVRLREELGRATAAAAAAAQGVAGAVSPIASSVRTLLTGVEQQMELFEARLTGLVTKLGESVAAAQQLGAQAIGGINARVAAELAALDTLRLHEVAKVKESTRIQREAAEERLATITRFAGDAIRAFQFESEARITLARRTGQNVQRLELEINANRLKLLQGIVEQYRAHLNSLVALEAGHLEKIKAIQEQRRNLNATLEDKIRELRRGTLTVAQQYNDRILQIDELLSKARQALIRGDTKLAEDLANKAFQLTDQIAQKVEDGEEVIVDAYRAAQIASERYTSATGILNASLTKREQAEKAGADAARQAADQVVEKLRTVEDQMEKVQELAAKGIEVRIALDERALDEVVTKLDAAITERERLVRINGDITAVQLELSRLEEELRKGITVNVDARTELITEKLAAIEKEVPELTVNVDKALLALDEVRKAAKAVETVRVQVESNAAEIAKVLDGINGKTYRAKVIVDVEQRGARLPPGTELPTFNRGGPVEPAQGFAAGGSVFKRRSWSTVPGSGNDDTVPAALGVGSFVMRKAAVQRYGAGLFRSLRAAALGQPFAFGGIAERILRGFRGTLRSFGESGGRLRRRTENLGRGSTGEIIEAAYRIFNPLIDAAKGLKKSRTGQNLVDYLGAVLEIITTTYSPEEAGFYLDKIASIFDALMGSIQTAKRFGVPIVMGAFAGADQPEDASGPSELFKQLERNMRTGGRFPQGTRKFAEGGSADTVPAWLTPGEFVLKPEAVRAIRERFGGNVLHMLNDLRLPRGALAHVIGAPRVQRFAEGGDVQPTSASFARGQPAFAGGGINAVFNLMDARVDDAWVHRYVVPALNRIAKKSG